jgi:hypothetical protein
MLHSIIIIIINIMIIIIIIIIGISFMQGIYAYIPEKNTVSLGKPCCSYSDVTIDGAHIASSCVDSIVYLRQHFPKYMCSA